MKHMSKTQRLLQVGINFSRCFAVSISYWSLEHYLHIQDSEEWWWELFLLPQAGQDMDQLNTWMIKDGCFNRLLPSPFLITITIHFNLITVIVICQFNTCITMIIGASSQLIIANIVVLMDLTTITEWNKIITMTIE